MTNPTYQTWLIECPYCGYIEIEPDEWAPAYAREGGDGEGDWSCPNCDEVATVTRYTTVSYTAKTKEPTSA